MNLSASFSFVVVVLSVVQLFGQSAADFDTAKLAHFEKLVRPALSKYCFECHATHSEANGGLVLDSRNGWEEGGDSAIAYQDRFCCLAALQRFWLDRSAITNSNGGTEAVQFLGN